MVIGKKIVYLRTVFTLKERHYYFPFDDKYEVNMSIGVVSTPYPHINNRVLIGERKCPPLPL